MKVNMKTHTFNKTMLSLAVLTLTGFAQAEGIEGIEPVSNPITVRGMDKVRVDPKTGYWIFQYTDTEDGKYKTRTTIPPTLIKPSVQSSVRSTGDTFEYSYTVHNDKTATQNINSFYVNVDGINTTTRPEPKHQSNPRLSPQEQTAETSKFFQIHDKWSSEQSERCDKFMVGVPEWNALTGCHQNGLHYNWSTYANGEKWAIKPGQTMRGAKFIIPFLPGVAMMQFSADVPESTLPPHMPSNDDTTEFGQKVLQLINTIGKETPVIAPQIAIPKPYSGAELARRIKADMQTWIVKKPGYELQTGNELITAPTLAALNRQFDLLIPALERKDKAAVRGIAKEMLTQIFTPHTDLDHHKFIEDDAIHNTKPKRTLSISADATVKNTAVMEPLHRVAARALGFNLMYLITQSERGK
jgi:hypothetical protein